MEITSVSNVNSAQYVLKKQENTVENDTKTSLELLNQMKLQPEYVPSIQERTIISAIESANKKLVGADREFEFSVHEKTKQIMVKILDKSTKEVVREIPSEKILDMIAAMCEMSGLLVDERR